jgi:ABC-type dipeptide/oligopeptide/nickel transport system permease component
MEIPEGASDDLAVRARADWQEWWYVHQDDYVSLEGGARIVATIGQTRYGKWVLRAVSGHFGVAADGEPIALKMKARAPVTLLVTSVAMLASFALAVPIGVVVAWRRGRPIDTAAAALLFLVYSLPTFVAAEILRRVFASPEGAGGAALLLPIATLTLASLATLSRYQRTAMLDVLGQDYVRTARAKGVSIARMLVVHALRNALLPTVTLAGLQLPVLIGGSFVVEETFAVRGLGWETIRAAEIHDAPWLLAMVLLAAVVTTVGLIASDVAYGVLDPRVREALLRRRGAT